MNLPCRAWKIQLLLINLICSASSSSAREDPRQRDRQALLGFKRGVTSDPSGLLSLWTDSSSSTDHCSWPGVSCDPRSRVSALNISAPSSSSCRALPNPFRDGTCSGGKVGSLEGEISPAIGRLTELRVLALPFHGFGGELPPEVMGLRKLRVLDLQGNFLSGELPATFARRLRVISLGFNRFSGGIPQSLTDCAGLEVLDLSHNQLNGTVPFSLDGGSFSSLKGLYLSSNHLSGPLPAEFGNACQSLENLDLSRNSLVGSIPGSIGNCNELQSLLLSSNQLVGAVPVHIGMLSKLRVLDVSRNRLSGPVPSELGACFELSVLVLTNLYDPTALGGEGDTGEFNNFEGGIHESIASLPKLRILWAPRASMEGRIPRNWGPCRSLEMVNLGQNRFMGEMAEAFTHCKDLRYLNLSSNGLTGQLHEDLSVPCMDVFDVSGNQFSGPIPRYTYGGCVPSRFPPYHLSGAYSSFFQNMARLEGTHGWHGSDFELTVLHNFGRNFFTGNIPPLLVAADRLQNQIVYALLVNGNNFTGPIPDHLFHKCKYTSGIILDLSKNSVSGVIPSEISSTCDSLMIFDASENRITGEIPSFVGSMNSLTGLDLSRNRLKGQIPESISQLKSLKHFSLAGNNLTGCIPSSLGRLRSLEVLDLSSNFLTGSIPSELMTLGNLSVLLLTNNKLSGRIPDNFDSMISLSLFNVSYNNLAGPVPLSAIKLGCGSVIGNPLFESCRVISFHLPPTDKHGRALGSLLYPPPAGNPPSKDGNSFNSIEIASIASASAIVSVLLALIVIYIYTRKCFPRARVQAAGKREVTPCTDIGVPVTYENVVRATGNFSASNCIGSGGFGATYKAEIAPGVIVAIKRLFVGRIQGEGVQQFHAEIKTLGRWRHPNLVTLIGFHVNETEMFLIYNYLPGGNLEKFIHERYKGPVDWKVLHKIALDVACALQYLHDECVPRILHRDVKPSNILLDNECNAYLSDFGLARLIGNSETHATTGVAGTFGYVAPEYAMTCRVSDKADVYSYGVVLLELISDKKALDPSFSPYGNGFNIVAWASMLLKQGRAREFFTEGLWDAGPHDDLVETLHLALKCTVDSLSGRPTMRQVVQRLRSLRPPTC